MTVFNNHSLKILRQFFFSVMFLLFVQLFIVAATPLFALNSAMSGDTVYKLPLAAWRKAALQ
jgi:hypothetical protein